MSRGKDKNGIGEGTFIKSDVLLSPAYTSLTRSALLIFNVFMLKRDINRQTREVRNKNNITVTYKELESKLPLSRGSIAKGFTELLAKGFIKTIYKGGIAQGDKNVYGLSEDWRFWKPADEPIEKRVKKNQAGYSAIQKHRESKTRSP